MVDDSKIEKFRQLFVTDLKPTKKVLVEFYKDDWEKIKKLKEDMDLNWKDFFKAISIWMDVFDSNLDAVELVTSMVQSKGEKKENG